MSVPAPPLPELFQFDHVFIEQGRWASIYPPGWPLLLALGWIVHAPWIVNPLLFGLSLFGTWLLAKELFDSRTAWMSVILFCASPFVLLMHAGFMAHPAALCSAAWCSYLFIRGLRSANRYALLGAGALAGLCFLIRPATALALLWPLWPWAWIERRAKTSLWALPSLLTFVVLFLAYNQVQFGSPFKTGYSLDPSFTPGKPSIQLFISNIGWYFRSLNQWLWEWPFPNLLMLVPLVLARTQRKELLLLFCSALSLVIAHCFFYWTDIVYAGPRYAFEAMSFISILAARSFQLIPEMFSKLRLRLGPAVGWAALIFAALFSFSRMPEQITFHSQMYHARSAEVVDAVRESRIGRNALVIIAGNPYVYGSFFFENALAPQSADRVFVRDIPALRDAALKAYSRRETWRVQIDMQPIEGPNRYPDRWRLTNFSITRLQ